MAGAALNLFGWDLNKPSTLKLVNKAGVQVFEPSLTDEEREWKYAGWNRAVERSCGWKSEFTHFVFLSRCFWSLTFFSLSFFF